MAIKISGETVVDDSKKGLFNDVVVKGGAGESGEITLNCENNSHGVKLKGPAHSAGADYTLTLPNTSGNSGEVLTTDGSGAMSWEEVVGNEISATAPTSPSQGALWTDTSEDPAAPILKTWNGSAWVAVGSAAPSEFAPVVNGVTLTENDPTGDRFTSQTFDVDINMLVEGAPHSQKGLKGEVTASFAIHPNTEAVASNNAVAFPNLTRTSNSGSYSQNAYPMTPVWAPGVTTGSNDWYSLYFPGGSGSNGYLVTVDPDDINNVGQYVVSNISLSGATLSRYGQYYPATPNNNYEYLVWWDEAKTNTKRFRMSRNTSISSATWSGGWSDMGRPWFDAATNQYYWTYDGYIYRGYGYGNQLAQTNYVGSYSSSGTNMCAVGNGKVVALRKYGSHQYVFVTDHNFADTASPSIRNVANDSEARWITFAAGYFWISASNDSLYRSTDGWDWTNVSVPRPNTGDNSWIHYLDTDPNNGSVRAWATSWTNGYSGTHVRQMFTTNNGGATWVLDWEAPTSNSEFFGRTIPLYGDGKVIFIGQGYSGGSKLACDQYPYSQQTVTLQGTGADYSQFNVGDAIRLSGSTEYEKEGEITSISGTEIGLNSPYTYQAGDVIEAKYPTSSGESTRYLIINASGAVTGTIGSDPGYVEVGPDISQTLTFPATFASGDTPDEELPAGTTLKVSAQATNSEGSSEYGPSNIVTPS
tara:strand:- start:580 stop:2679 length:2100 start_codon:yes stop_codon:yes gene_type:complete